MKIELTQECLDGTIEALEAVHTRFELEAACLLRIPEGRVLAQKRLKQAEEAEALVNFYLHL